MSNYYRDDPKEYTGDIEILYEKVDERFSLDNFFMMVVALLADAYDEGYDEGYDIGYNEGYDEGLETEDL